MTKVDFLNRIQQSPEELERLLVNTKTRILNEIGRMDCNENNPMPDFASQMALIMELQDYGFEREAFECIKIMGTRIDELNPALKAWYGLQMKYFGMPFTPTPKKINQPIFIETFIENNGVLEVTYCLDGVQDDVNPEWNTSALLASDLLEFAKECGLNTVVIDSADHAGQHIQDSMKQPIFSHVQENIETYIKNYLRAGWPSVKI